VVLSSCEPAGGQQTTTPCPLLTPQRTPRRTGRALPSAHRTPRVGVPSETESRALDARNLPPARSSAHVRRALRRHVGRCCPHLTRCGSRRSRQPRRSTVTEDGEVRTTGRAAVLLGVSRPTLVAWLEGGRIPHHRWARTGASAAATSWRTGTTSGDRPAYRRGSPGGRSASDLPACRTRSTSIRSGWRR